ncbi:Type II secretion system protein G [uncultured bacterium]|nr:Type II secretion system protein G [uncultured bacterium]
MKKYYRAENYAKRYHKQVGMTLIELTVVLLVLIGLAGLLIPYVAGFGEKTHDSTTVSSITELNNTLQRFRVQRNAFPDNLETLATGIASTTTYPDLITPALVTPAVINQTMLDSLRKVGVTSVLPNVASGSALGNATFKSTEGINPTALTAASTLAYVQPAAWGGNVAAHLAYSFGGTPADYPNTIDTATACYAYVAFGIGDRSELTGAAVQSAPVLFTSNGDTSPDKKYSRFLAVFKVQASTVVADGCPDAAQPAQFVGAAANLDFPALVGTAASLSWSTSRMTSN